MLVQQAAGDGDHEPDHEHRQRQDAPEAVSEGQREVGVVRVGPVGRQGHAVHGREAGRRADAGPEVAPGEREDGVRLVHPVLQRRVRGARLLGRRQAVSARSTKTSPAPGTATLTTTTTTARMATTPARMRTERRRPPRRRHRVEDQERERGDRVADHDRPALGGDRHRQPGQHEDGERDPRRTDDAALREGHAPRCRRSRAARRGPAESKKVIGTPVDLDRRTGDAEHPHRADGDQDDADHHRRSEHDPLRPLPRHRAQHPPDDERGEGAVVVRAQPDERAVDGLCKA